MLDHAITNVIFRYRQINKDMPVTEIGRRFRALWTAIDHLIHHYEKDTPVEAHDRR